MKAQILITLLILSSFNGISQSKASKDSLLAAVCNSLNTDKANSDTATIEQAFLKHLFPYLKRFSNSDSLNEFTDKMIYRLSHECPEFAKMIERQKIFHSNGWRFSENEPQGTVSNVDCSDFFHTKSLKYLISDIDTVNAIVSDSNWEDHFSDHTYSKYSIEKLNDCEFSIILIESTNPSIQNDFQPGYKRKYKIITKTKSYFEIFTDNVIESGHHYIFKLWY